MSKLNIELISQVLIGLFPNKGTFVPQSFGNSVCSWFFATNRHECLDITIDATEETLTIKKYLFPHNVSENTHSFKDVYLYNGEIPTMPNGDVDLTAIEFILTYHKNIGGLQTAR